MRLSADQALQENILVNLKTQQCNGLAGSPADQESTCNAGDPGLIPGSGSSPGEGMGYTLQNIRKLKNRAAQLLKTKGRDLPGSPVAKSLCF